MMWQVPVQMWPVSVPVRAVLAPLTCEAPAVACDRRKWNAARDASGETYHALALRRVGRHAARANQVGGFLGRLAVPIEQVFGLLEARRARRIAAKSTAAEVELRGVRCGSLATGATNVRHGITGHGFRACGAARSRSSKSDDSHAPPQAPGH